MLNTKTCNAIDENIKEFTQAEMVEFRQTLCNEILDAYDLAQCIRKSNGEDIHLDTIVRDQYINAFLKMHISE